MGCVYVHVHVCVWLIQSQLFCHKKQWRTICYVGCIPSNSPFLLVSCIFILNPVIVILNCLGSPLKQKAGFQYFQYCKQRYTQSNQHDFWPFQLLFYIFFHPLQNVLNVEWLPHFWKHILQLIILLYHIFCFDCAKTSNIWPLSL